MLKGGEVTHGESLGDAGRAIPPSLLSLPAAFSKVAQMARRFFRYAAGEGGVVA